MNDPFLDPHDFVIVIVAIAAAILLAPLGFAAAMFGGIAMLEMLNKIVKR